MLNLQVSSFPILTLTKFCLEMSNSSSAYTYVMLISLCTSLAANSLDFEVSGQNAFEIPLANVSHSITGKNEVTLEFHQNDDAAVSLMELRFHIPSDNNPESDPVQVCLSKISASKKKKETSQANCCSLDNASK